MKKLSYILILLIILPMLLVVSCGEDKSNDTTPPRVENVRFNVNDTIQYTDNGVNKVIVLNDSTTGSLETDIMVIGKKIRFRGHFADDKGLSTAYFHIWGDTLIVNDIDTAYNMKRLLPTYMFGKTEVEIGLLGTILVDPLPVTIKRKNSSINLIIRESKDNYCFSIRCADMAGNEDVTSYSKKKIIVRTRKSIVDEALNNPEAFK